MNQSEKKHEIEEKILSTRQQIDFEANNLRFERDYSSDNTENPDVAEESKNFDDPAESAIETSDLNALKSAEKKLESLLKELEELEKNQSA
jgi:hypothetical protein